MRINGVYVGLGAGYPPDPPDSSDEIAKIKTFLKAKFTPARNTFDPAIQFLRESLAA